jgi:hypothetical protein
MYMCDCCRRLTDLTYYKRTDQYLCEECLFEAQLEDAEQDEARELDDE